MKKSMLETIVKRMETSWLFSSKQVQTTTRPVFFTTFNKIFFERKLYYFTIEFYMRKRLEFSCESKNSQEFPNLKLFFTHKWWEKTYF